LGKGEEMFLMKKKGWGINDFMSPNNKKKTSLFRFTQSLILKE
jgi:hypothetical protein